MSHITISCHSLAISVLCLSSVCLPISVCLPSSPFAPASPTPALSLASARCWTARSSPCWRPLPRCHTSTRTRSGGEGGEGGGTSRSIHSTLLLLACAVYTCLPACLPASSVSIARLCPADGGGGGGAVQGVVVVVCCVCLSLIVHDVLSACLLVCLSVVCLLD